MTDKQQPDQYLNITITSVKPPSDHRGVTFGLVAETNLPVYLKQSYTLTRTFLELERLWTYLCKAFPERIPPPLPPQPQNGQTNLESLKPKLQFFFTRIFHHPIYRTSEGTRSFLETEFEFSPSSTTTSNSSSPSLSKKSSLGFMSFNMAPKEVDIFFEQVKANTEGVESGLEQLVRSAEKCGRCEMMVGKAGGDVGACLVESGLGEDKALSRALTSLGKAFQASQNVMYEQSQTHTHLTTNAHPLLQTTQTALTSLTHRLTLLTTYTTACKTTQKRLTQISKLNSSSRIPPERVNAALDDLAESKAIEAECREKFKTGSEVLREETINYTRVLDKDLEGVVEEFVRGMVEGVRKEIRIWEGCLAGLGGE